jgi:hypothetical protein
LLLFCVASSAAKRCEPISWGEVPCQIAENTLWQSV